MAEWSGEYISPYAEHGKKSEQVKKITVSIPLKVLKILTDERTRRQVNNLRHAIGKDGRLIFDFPSVDPTGAPLDYFFGKEDPVVNEVRILRPRIGRTEQTLADYQIHNGDTIFLIPDPFPG